MNVVRLARLDDPQYRQLVEDFWVSEATPLQYVDATCCEVMGSPLPRVEAGL